MDTLKNNDKYSKFVEILEETGMANTLKANPTKGFTVFAPTNDAIKVAPRLSKEIKADIGKYVISPVVYTQALPHYTTLTTVNKDTIRLFKMDEETIKVEQAYVVDGNISATNGVIHGIDAILFNNN